MNFASEPYIGKRTATPQELRDENDQKRDSAKIEDNGSQDMCEYL